MRSNQIYLATGRISNRFALCGTAARSVRIIHKDGDLISDSVSDAFDGISGKGFRIRPVKLAAAYSKKN